MPCFGNIMRVRFSSGQEVGHWRSYCPMAASWAMSSINAPEDFGALPASIEVREVHLLIQRPVSTKIILVTTLVDPKRYPKAKLAHLSTALASNGSEFQASQNDFEDGDDFAKTRKWCRKKFGCICLRTTCCEVKCGNRSNRRCCPCGCPCKELDNSSISSDRSWLRQPPKTVVASTQPPCHQ